MVGYLHDKAPPPPWMKLINLLRSLATCSGGEAMLAEHFTNVHKF
jgi:hypothetical protein